MQTKGWPQQWLAGGAIGGLLGGAMAQTPVAVEGVASGPLVVASPQTAASAVTLPTVTSVGRSESGTYRAQEASGAKASLPVRELPQSVRVMTRQTLDDLGATRLDDALDYVGGVSRQNSFGGLWDNVAIRGLAGHEDTGMSTLLNGFAGNRGFNAPRDMAAVERIEFLKGPAAALYGSSEPGGTLNIVSKRPSRQSGHALEGSVGSFGLKRGSLDSTGALGASAAYRLNVALEDRDSFRDHLSSQRQVLAPALTWVLGDGAVLDYTGEWLRHRAPLDRGVVAIDGQLGAVPRERFLGEPGDGDVTVTNESHQWVWSQDWNPDWRSRVGLSYRETALSGFSTEASTLQDDDRTLRRQRRYRNYDSDDVALQAEVNAQLAAGSVQHELLLGAEAFRYRLDSVMDRINPSDAAPNAIDVTAPVYGQSLPAPKANTSTAETQRNTALYVQDTVPLGSDWRLMVGVRADRYRQSLHNRIKDSRVEQSPHATTPRIGLSWLPTAQWTAYANAGQSFRPNRGVNASGQSFKAEKGTAYELGTKWQNERGTLGATAAVFNIQKRHVLTADPVDSSQSVATGQVRSRGLELDLSGQLSAAWRLNGSLVLNDAEVMQDNTLQVGSRLLNVPKVSGSVLAVYEQASSQGQRWGAGAGLTHVGQRLGQAYTQAEANAGTPTFELPSYTTAKALGFWRFSPKMRLSIDVENVFDKTDYTSSYSRQWVAPGTPRSATLTLQAKL